MGFRLSFMVLAHIDMRMKLPSLSLEMVQFQFTAHMSEGFLQSTSPLAC